jgi:hypothetical protein
MFSHAFDGHAYFGVQQNLCGGGCWCGCVRQFGVYVVCVGGGEGGDLQGHGFVEQRLKDLPRRVRAQLCVCVCVCTKNHTHARTHTHACTHVQQHVGVGQMK